MTDPIVLPEKLDNAAAPTIFKLLRDKEGKSVQLDGKNVRTLGGLCAQIILAAVSDWRASNQSFELIASDPMLRDLRRLGFESKILEKDPLS